jgi:hypothetical protein
MSLIAVQAGVGGHVIRSDVAAAEQRLEVIADTSRKALSQTRSMLGLVLRGTRPTAPLYLRPPSSTSTSSWRTCAMPVSIVALTVGWPGSYARHRDRAHGVPHRPEESR